MSRAVKGAPRSSAKERAKERAAQEERREAEERAGAEDAHREAEVARGHGEADQHARLIPRLVAVAGPPRGSSGVGVAHGARCRSHLGEGLPVQEAVRGDEGRIEHGYQLAMTATEAGIEVACLGMPSFGTMPVAAAQSLGQLPHLVTATVIEPPDGGVGIALLRAAQKRSLQHRQRNLARHSR